MWKWANYVHAEAARVGRNSQQSIQAKTENGPKTGPTIPETVSHRKKAARFVARNGRSFGFRFWIVTLAP